MTNKPGPFDPNFVQSHKCPIDQRLGLALASGF